MKKNLIQSLFFLICITLCSFVNEWNTMFLNMSTQHLFYFDLNLKQMALCITKCIYFMKTILSLFFNKIWLNSSSFKWRTFEKTFNLIFYWMTSSLFLIKLQYIMFFKYAINVFQNVESCWILFLKSANSVLPVV